MLNQQLSDYVRKQLQEGNSKEKIKSELLGSGWQEMDINHVLGISVSTQPPRPPSTPSFTSTDQQQLDPKAVWIFFISWLSPFLLIAPVIIINWLVSMPTNPISEYISVTVEIVLLIFLGIFVSIFVWSKLTYHFYRYELTEEGFRKELGVIIKKYVTIPYDRIQNVDIHRGIIARILGLSDLNIQTAGGSISIGSSSEGILPGLSRETAEQLRNELIHRARQTRNQGL